MINRKKIKEILKEATSETNSRGSYIGPLQVGVRIFDKTSLNPFNISVSKYDSPELEYDSYDNVMDTPKKKIKSIEKKAKKISNYMKKHPEKTSSDEDGNIINPYPKKINEADTSNSSGSYNGPMEVGLRKWKKHHLEPFNIELDSDFNKLSKQKGLKNNIKKIVGMWDKNKDGSHEIEVHPTHTINEDLAVWFGKKKKPKGSKQPKGPWVDICRKVNGKHPPCGRKDADKGSYPKCRAAGVAGKMSDSQKRSACQQKRRAEKKDTQTGKGQKPVMTSYKPKNESTKKKKVRLTESQLISMIKSIISKY